MEAQVTFDTATTDRRPENSSTKAESLRASLATKMKGKKTGKETPTIFFLVEEPMVKYSITMDAMQANWSRILGVYIDHREATRVLQAVLTDLEHMKDLPDLLVWEDSSSDDDSDCDSAPPLICQSTLRSLEKKPSKDLVSL
jgi:hypothetical protein